jgi:hypothetical protein
MSNSDKIVLICATGRSGSTTLQRIINSIPNSNICGENFGAIQSLLEFYVKLQISTFDYIPGHLNPISYDQLIKRNIKPAWYNSYKLTNMEDNIRNMIRQMFKKDESTSLWGFKEIRYDKKKLNILKKLKSLFPSLKIIVHIRENIIDQSNSGWHQKDQNAIFNLKKLNKEYIDFYEQNKEWCFFLTFERMFHKPTLKNLFHFLDCDEHFNEINIDEILKNNIKDK